MPKSERKRATLNLLADSGLALPPSVVYENLVLRGATFSYKTVHRHLNELVDEGFVERIPQKDGYYRITDDGLSYLQEE